MGDAEKAVAQLVMKRSDGQSILSVDAATAETAGAGDVPEDRAKRIRARLEEMGFEVQAGNLNTLSITGSDELFEETFGISPSSAQHAGAAAHATKTPSDLEEFVADVFVTPPPEFFP